jgi:hypothetical protein
MAYDEGLAQRLREILADRYGVEEKRMFGGIAFMLRGHMCCGIVGDTLMVRTGPDHYAAALQRPHAREMNFTGKAMKGFVYVAPAGIEDDEDLQAWVALAVGFVNSLPGK